MISFDFKFKDLLSSKKKFVSIFIMQVFWLCYFLNAFVVLELKMKTHLMLQCKVFPYFTFVTISYNEIGWTYEWYYGFQCGFNQGVGYFVSYVGLILEWHVATKVRLMCYNHMNFILFLGQSCISLWLDLSQISKFWNKLLILCDWIYC